MRAPLAGSVQCAAWELFVFATVVSGVKAEGQVANGLAKADGHVSRMRGEGARAGVGSNAGVHAGLGAGHATAGAGLGVDVKVGK